MGGANWPELVKNLGLSLVPYPPEPENDILVYKTRDLTPQPQPTVKDGKPGAPLCLV
jgi:hypothetical protein